MGDGCDKCRDSCGSDEAQCGRRAIRARIDELLVEERALRGELEDLGRQVTENTISQNEGERRREVLLKGLDERLESIKMLEGEWAKLFKPSKEPTKTAKEEKKKDDTPQQNKIESNAYNSVVGLARAAIYTRAYADRAIAVASACIAEVGRAHGYVFQDRPQQEFSKDVERFVELRIACDHHPDPAQRQAAIGLWAQLQNGLRQAAGITGVGRALSQNDIIAIIELKVIAKRGENWTQQEYNDFIGLYPATRTNLQLLETLVNDLNNNFKVMTLPQKAEAFTNAFRRLLDSNADSDTRLQGITIMEWAVRRISASLAAVNKAHEESDLKAFAENMVTTSKEVEVLQEYLPSKAAVAQAFLGDKDVRTRVLEAIRTIRTRALDLGTKFHETAVRAITTGNLAEAFTIVSIFGNSVGIQETDQILSAVEAGLHLDNLATKLEKKDLRDMSEIGRRWYEDVRRATDVYLEHATDAQVSSALMKLVVDLFESIGAHQQNINVAVDSIRSMFSTDDAKYDADLKKLDDATVDLKKKMNGVLDRVKQLVPTAQPAPVIRPFLVANDRVGNYLRLIESASAKTLAFSAASLKAMDDRNKALEADVRRSLRAMMDEYALATTSDDKRTIERQQEALRGSRTLIVALGGILSSLVNRQQVIRSAFGGPDQLPLVRDDFKGFEGGKLARIGKTVDEAARYAMALACAFLVEKIVVDEKKREMEGALRSVDSNVYDEMNTRRGGNGTLATTLRGHTQFQIMRYARNLLRAWDWFMSRLLRAVDLGLDRYSAVFTEVRIAGAGAAGDQMAMYISTNAASDGRNELVGAQLPERNRVRPYPVITEVVDMNDEQKEAGRDLAYAYARLWDAIGNRPGAEAPTRDFAGLEELEKTYALRREYDLQIMRIAFTGDPDRKSVV